MRAHRFYTDALDDDNIEILLDSDQSKHARRTLRLGEGDRVELFDGCGRLVVGEITALGRQMTVRVTERQTAPRRRPELTIAVAIPKGDRAATLVEKLSELGADRIVPLITERSIVVPSDHKIERFGRIAVESAKQCGRLWLMQIDQPVAIETWLAQADQDQRLILAIDSTENKSAVDQIITTDGDETIASVSMMVGPEGGWNDKELEAAQAAGFTPWQINQQVLRVETAAIAAVAIWRAVNG